MAAGFSGRGRQVGADAGAQRLGACVYELDPGATAMPYHFHRGNEELLVVLSGTPTLRTPDGERELREGEVAAFRVGPAGAHQVINRSPTSARYVMFSTRRSPDVTGYPDSGKTGFIAFPQEGDDGPARAIFRDAGATGYFDGEQAPS
jgi:uncharacterized cupin superfamily protein